MPAQPQGHSLQGKASPQGTQTPPVILPHTQTVPKTPASLLGRDGERPAGKERKGRKEKGGKEREKGKGKRHFAPLHGQAQHRNVHGLLPAFPKAQPGAAGKAEGAHSPRAEHLAAERGRWEPGLPDGALENRITHSMSPEWAELGVQGRLW